MEIQRWGGRKLVHQERTEQASTSTDMLAKNSMNGSAGLEVVCKVEETHLHDGENVEKEREREEDR